MFKRTKDGGFTLIELMIVIAVIGILAVVLVPKMSGVKETAKISGVTTNAKSVEAFIVVNIDKWQRDKTTASTLETTIESKFRGGDDLLENPLGGTKAIDAGSAPSAEKGAVLAIVTMDDTDTRVKQIEIKAYGNGTTANDIIYEKVIKPN